MIVLALSRYAHDEPTIAVDVIGDLIWVHAQAHDKLEHVLVRAGPDNLALILFMAHANSEQAVGAASAIWKRAASVSTQLRGWRAELAIQEEIV